MFCRGACRRADGMVGLSVLELEHISFAGRLLDPVSILVLLVIYACQCGDLCSGVLFACAQTGGVLINSVVGALSVATCTLVFGRYYGARGIVISCCVGNVLGLVWATYKFQKYRRIWHAA